MDKQNIGNGAVYQPHPNDREGISKIGDAQQFLDYQVDVWTLLFDIEHLWLRGVVAANLPDGIVCDSVRGADEPKGPKRHVTFRLNRVEHDAGRITNDRLGAAALLEVLRLLATPLREEIDNADASSVSLRMDEFLEALSSALYPLLDAAWARVRLRYFHVVADTATRG